MAVTPEYMTTAEVAAAVGSEEWRVRRLYEDGTLPEPQRFANRRAIHVNDLPRVIEALENRSWLPELAQTTN